jgi:hypothetical protein
MVWELFFPLTAEEISMETVKKRIRYRKIENVFKTLGNLQIDQELIDKIITDQELIEKIIIDPELFEMTMQKLSIMKNQIADYNMVDLLYYNKIFKENPILLTIFKENSSIFNPLIKNPKLSALLKPFIQNPELIEKSTSNQMKDLIKQNINPDNILLILRATDFIKKLLKDDPNLLIQFLITNQDLSIMLLNKYSLLIDRIISEYHKSLESKDIQEIKAILDRNNQNKTITERIVSIWLDDTGWSHDFLKDNIIRPNAINLIGYGILCPAIEDIHRFSGGKNDSEIFHGNDYEYFIDVLSEKL